MGAIIIILLIIVGSVATKRKRGRKPYYIRRREAIAAQKAIEAKAKQDAARQRERERIQEEKAAQAAAKADAARRKAAERAAVQAAKTAAERIQAREDIPYYRNQLARFYDMIGTAKAELHKARERCNLDFEMNSYAAVIPEKIIAKHTAERDKAYTKVIRLENQIHAMEKRLAKAETLLNT